nr:hypothetical protein [Gammaproteobacteria bacterium]
MLDAEGIRDAATILRTGSSRIVETGYDNWNGGTTIYTIYLTLPPTHYARVSRRKAQLETQINERLKVVIEQFTKDWCSVSIVPEVGRTPASRDRQPSVPRETRQNILDGLRLERVRYCEELDDVDFLNRIFDLTSLPSYDSRFEDAAGDIWQHRYNNHDWDDDWVFDDARFDLLNGPTEVFLEFLCHMVHPVVRPDRNEALRLVEHFNDQLRRHGWALVEEEKIAGRPRFIARQLKDSTPRSVSRARSVADALDAGWMQKEIERLENAVERDPALAIGTAKELIETCCKSILSKRNVQYPRSADIPELTKLLAKELQLVPDDIPEKAKGAETIRLILRNLSALTHYLAELRSLYGTGHGRDGKHRGLEPRHARLAVGTAVVFIDFVTETYRRRSEPK